jgi:hypothetical protein
MFISALASVSKLLAPSTVNDKTRSLFLSSWCRSAVVHIYWRLFCWKWQAVSNLQVKWNCRFWRVLTMVYNTQDYWVFWTFPSSGILENRKHDVSETVSISVLRWKGGGDTYSVGPNWVGVFSPLSETSCFLVSRIPDDGKVKKKTVILCKMELFFLSVSIVSIRTLFSVWRLLYLHLCFSLKTFLVSKNL